MKYDNPVKEAATKLRSAQKNLLEVLREVAEINPHLKNIEFRGSARRPIRGAVNFGCIITVEGDSQGEADRHCMEMSDQGCSCQSVGPSVCECDCTGL